MKHLWECDHAYYCNLGNYFSNDCEEEYECWEDFATEYVDADFDYNLLFRFDWREGEGWELPNFSGDENARDARLYLFWMGQRKGVYRYTEVKVCRADEPEVLKFLQLRLDHLMRLWEPLVPTTDQQQKDGYGD